MWIAWGPMRFAKKTDTDLAAYMMEAGLGLMRQVYDALAQRLKELTVGADGARDMPSPMKGCRKDRSRVW